MCSLRMSWPLTWQSWHHRTLQETQVQLAALHRQLHRPATAPAPLPTKHDATVRKVASPRAERSVGCAVGEASAASGRLETSAERRAQLRKLAQRRQPDLHQLKQGPVVHHHHGASGEEALPCSYGISLHVSDSRGCIGDESLVLTLHGAAGSSRRHPLHSPGGFLGCAHCWSRPCRRITLPYHLFPLHVHPAGRHLCFSRRLGGGQKCIL